MEEPLSSVVSNLLSEVSDLAERQRRTTRAHALDFNVFEVLGRATDEVRGHSAIITELLDPDGSHGQGYRFLGLFLEHLSREDSRFVKLQLGETRWIVRREEPFTIGHYSGRIDILLDDGSVMLIIENKIYAADQPAQLDRYRRFAQDSERDPLLLYLTLDGSPPSDNSLHGDETNEDPFNLAPPHISLISYKVFINNWLTACIQSAAELPHLRETLVQYQRLIVSLTHGTLNKEMTMEISDKMLQPDRLRAALEIEKSIPEAKAKLQTKFWECLRGKIDAQMPEIRELKLPNITFSDEGVRSYYLKNRNTPKGYGLTYEVSSLGDDWQAVFAILVESRVYCGFYLLYQGAFREPDNKTIDCTPLHAAVAKVDGEMVGSDFALGGRWWYTDPKLDFASFGEECIRLADGNYLEEIAQRIGKQCVVKIRRFLQ